MNMKELIYKSGKGVELQVWDDGTVFARSLYDPEITVSADTTIEKAVEKLLKKVARKYKPQ